VIGQRARLSIFCLCAVLALTSCGYHVAGRATRLPATVQTIAIPAFENTTQQYKIEQMLTQAVVHDFVTRTKYHIISQPGPDADATLKGTVTTVQIAPVTFDSTTGRASNVLVTVGMKVSLVDSKGKVLFENQNYTFREQYQVSRELSSFFEEETPAMQRLSREFAQTLVSNILEAF
jgi:outer membrane lipopolysaccharide assembly protein LptE/RlpB